MDATIPSLPACMPRAAPRRLAVCNPAAAGMCQPGTANAMLAPALPKSKSCVATPALLTPPEITQHAAGRVSPGNPTQPRLFLDLFAGPNTPVTKAMESLGADTFQPQDVLFAQSMDILDDMYFEDLMTLAWSGLVGAAWAGTECKEFSRLKLHPRPRTHPNARAPMGYSRHGLGQVPSPPK